MKHSNQSLEEKNYRKIIDNMATDMKTVEINLWRDNWRRYEESSPENFVNYIKSVKK